MKNNQSTKYPVSLFLIGILMNLIKNFFLGVPAIILLIVGIWVKWCLVVGLVLLLVDLLISLIEQIQIRRAVIDSDDPSFKEWQDAILTSDWKNNIVDLTESKINDAADDMLE